jgi:hypothetical protein
MTRGTYSILRKDHGSLAEPGIAPKVIKSLFRSRSLLRPPRAILRGKDTRSRVRSEPTWKQTKDSPGKNPSGRPLKTPREWRPFGRNLHVHGTTLAWMCQSARIVIRSHDSALKDFDIVSGDPVVHLPESRVTPRNRRTLALVRVDEQRMVHPELTNDLVAAQR